MPRANYCLRTAYLERLEIDFGLIPHFQPFPAQRLFQIDARLGCASLLCRVVTLLVWRDFQPGLEVRGAKRFGQGRQHVQPMRAPDPLDFAQLALMPATDEQYSAVEFEDFEFPDDLYRVGFAKRQIENNQIRLR